VTTLSTPVPTEERCAHCRGKVAAWRRVDADGRVFCTWVCARSAPAVRPTPERVARCRTSGDRVRGGTGQR